MPVEAIVEKILSDAKTEAEEILRSYRQKVEALEKERDGEVGRLRTEADEEGKLRGEEAVRRLLSSTQMEARKSILRLKQDLIDQVFEVAHDKVRRLKDVEYREFIKALILKVAETGDEEIVVGKRDTKRITPAFVTSVNKALKKAGKEGKLHLGTPSSEITGGVILRRGRKEVNATLSALFAAARRELESEVAEVLLGREG